ncbi:hypothetical protein EB118_01790 [bacterium]|nr:hypothetical protein [bacterium]NDC94636.1 hypothetical protein [bacterium]NDG28820.1 hypothetical protein [bacterium]
MSNTQKLKDGRTGYARLTSNSLSTHTSSYLSRNSWNGKHEAFESLASAPYGQPEPLFMARAAFELAATAPDTIRPDVFLEKMVLYALKAQESKRKSLSTALTADMFYANIPLLIAIHIDKQHPSAERIQKAKLDSIKSLAENRPKNSLQRKDAVEYSGAAAELCSLVMLQSYSVDKLGGSDWTPVPTLLSEDCDSKKGSSQNNNWDISVYTGKDVELCYKAQIKYGNIVRSRNYRNDIAVINIKKDLILPGEDELRVGSLIHEIKKAHSDYDQSKFTDTLRQRTDIMLDMLDSPGNV